MLDDGLEVMLRIKEEIHFCVFKVIGIWIIGQLVILGTVFWFGCHVGWRSRRRIIGSEWISMYDLLSKATDGFGLGLQNFTILMMIYTVRYPKQGLHFLYLF